MVGQWRRSRPVEDSLAREELLQILADFDTGMCHRQPCTKSWLLWPSVAGSGRRSRPCREFIRWGRLLKAHFRRVGLDCCPCHPILNPGSITPILTGHLFVVNSIQSQALLPRVWPPENLEEAVRQKMVVISRLLASKNWQILCSIVLINGQALRIMKCLGKCRR